MSVPKRIFQNELSADLYIGKEDQNYHYLTRVLRAEVEDSFQFFNGKGQIALGTLEDISKNHCYFKLNAPEQLKDLNYTLHLGQALLKGNSLDLVVQKAIEIGVTQISLFPSVYSEGGRKLEEKKMERFLNIMQRAAEQSMCYWLPDCTFFKSLEDWLASLPHQDTCRLLCDPRGEKLSSLSIQSSVIYAIGPEGGFAPQETLIAKSAGFETVALQANVLRAETAGFIAGAVFRQFIT
ncbi:MAG: 16S rRNA (uracil(1498)-N(3))-methyltransferase [Pseudomonadota bacterium]